jgi:hypothetical protein
MLFQLALTSLSCVAMTACVHQADSLQTQQFTDINSANSVRIQAKNLPGKKQNWENYTPSATSDSSQEKSFSFANNDDSISQHDQREYVANSQKGDMRKNSVALSQTGSYMTLTPTGFTNALGNPIYELRLYVNGNAIASYNTVAGRAYTQNRNRHQAGTEAPLPDGKYRVAKTSVAGTIPEAGDRFLAIQPLFRTGRSALGIHYDPSFEKNNGEDGTSGCIGLTNLVELDEMLNYVRIHRPQYLEVNIQ